MPRIERPEVMREPLGHKYWRHRDFEGLWGIFEGKQTIWKTARCFITPASPRAWAAYWAARRPRDGVTPPHRDRGGELPRRSDEHDDRHVVATGEVSDGH